MSPSPSNAADLDRATRLADAALRIARTVIGDAMDELGVIASGDHTAMVAACDILRVTDIGAPSRSRAAQHMAFSLVTALLGGDPNRQPGSP